MDDSQIEKLVERVARAFPDDLSAQRQAWEFIEMVMSAWETATAASSEPIKAATSADPSESARRRLMEACRALLRETGGRLASGVQVLFPTGPDLATLARGASEVTLQIEPEAAAAVDAELTISLEGGADFLTLLARVGRDMSSARLGAVLLTADGAMEVQRFERVGDSIAAAHFEFAPSGGPVSVVVVLFDGEG